MRHRWAVAAAVIVALVGLTELSLTEAGRQPQLGVRAARVGDQLVIDWVQPAGWAWDAGVRPGDVVVTVAERPVAPGTDPAAVAGARVFEVRSARGIPATATVAAAADTSVRYRRSFLALALSFVVVGVAVFVLANDPLVARVLFACASAWATALIAAVATPSGRAWALALVYLAVLAFGLTTLLLFLTFPIDRLRTRAGRAMAWAAGGATLPLAAAYCWVVAVKPTAYAAVQPMAFALVVAELLAASVLIVRGLASVSPQRREARRALALVALGTLAGLLPFCLLALGPRLVGFNSLVPPDVAILSVALLPLSFGAAVFSRQFLGITRLVRRGLVALVVWVGLLGAYGLGLSALWRAGSTPEGHVTVTPGMLVVGLAVVMGTFPPLQQWLRQLLERALFRDVYDYAAILHELSTEIARRTGGYAAAAHVLARLGQTLDLSWAAIVVTPDGPPLGPFRWGDCPGELAVLLALSTTPTPNGTNGMPEGITLVPLIVDDAAVGTLAVGPKRRDVALLPEDVALLATLAPVLATALQNARLVRRLEGQVETLGERERELAALSGQLMRAQEEERQRIALDLHDDPLQRAVLLAREIGDAPGHPVTPRDLHALEDVIGSLQAICTNLRPSSLDNFGLAGGLERLVNDLRARAEDIHISLNNETASGGSYGRLPRDLETAIYRVAQEALNNCLKHAEATSIAVTLRREPRLLELQVVDNGRGYGPGGASDGRPRSLQLGILGMHERLRPWGGGVHVERGALGGTTVTAEVPMEIFDGRVG